MNKKYNILFTIPNLDTAGSGLALYHIASRLDKNIFNVSICIQRAGGSIYETIKNQDIPIIIYPYILTGKPSRFKRFIQAFRFAFFILKNKIDLVHSFHYSDDYFEALGARMGFSKWIYTKKNMSWKGRGWKLRTALAHTIIAQNTDMMQQFFNQSKKQIVTIPRGVDTSKFRPLHLEVNSIKSELRLPDSSKIIITVANLVPRKGIDYLIQSFADLNLDKKNYHLVIVGNDTLPYADKLKSLTKENNITNAVHFLGSRTNINELLNCADFFVLPTTNLGEGSPVALLEAMSAGLPCIASDVYGIRDQLHHLPNQMFEESDVESLSNKLQTLIDMSDTAIEEIRQKQYELIQSNYAIEIEVKKHSDLYLKVLTN